MNSPFHKNNPPEWRVHCPVITLVESRLKMLGRRLPRAHEHKKPVIIRVVCGDENTGQAVLFMLKMKGCKSVVVIPREECKRKWIRKDPSGTGPVVEARAEHTELWDLWRTMGPAQPKDGTAATAKVQEIKPVATPPE